MYLPLLPLARPVDKAPFLVDLARMGSLRRCGDDTPKKRRSFH